MLKHSSAPKYRAVWIQTISGETHVVVILCLDCNSLWHSISSKPRSFSMVILIPFVYCAPSKPLFRDSAGISLANIHPALDFRWNLLTLWISLVTDLQGGHWPNPENTTLSQGLVAFAPNFARQFCVCHSAWDFHKYKCGYLGLIPQASLRLGCPDSEFAVGQGKGIILPEPPLGQELSSVWFILLKPR